MLDTITQDIIKFRALQLGEDTQFCGLVHLINRSFNTPKEVGSQSYIDNSGQVMEEFVPEI